MKLLTCKDLSPLTEGVINQWYATFLCDDSHGNTSHNLLAHSTFQPESFTIYDRMQNPLFLARNERNFDHYLVTMIQRKLEELRQEGHIIFATCSFAAITDVCVGQVHLFFHLMPHLSKEIMNQEFPWIVNRILAYCLFGNPTVHSHIYTTFHTFVLHVMPAFLSLYHQKLEELSLKHLLQYTIASGLVGCDMKRRGTVRDDIIALKPLLHAPVDVASQTIWEGMTTLAQPGLTIDDWDAFSLEVIEKPCTMLWFADDLAETFLDLYLILRLLQHNPGLHIDIVAKNGYYENDAAIADLPLILQCPVFAALNQMRRAGRFGLVPHGPCMATANLRKIDPIVCSYIEHADVLFLKGSSIHELFQGGINKPCYTAYIVAREFNESETGFDEQHGPLLFFRTEPGEYTFWGFKGRATKKQSMPNGKEMPLCVSTLQDHRRRQNLCASQEIIAEIDWLLQVFTDEREHWHPWKQELALLVSRLHETQEHPTQKMQLL